MPDPTYKTFLSPGSCQLEVTDLVASANDDKGVDLYGVAWEIEQVLIAGEGFAASPTDVWVNERGILNVGQSLFDKINRTALDNTNIPGQCTVVVKATSLVDSSKVARLKVLVGYPSEGGGGGGGVTLGTLSGVIADDLSVSVGDEVGGGISIISISVNSQPVTDSTVSMFNNTPANAAAGSTVEAIYNYVTSENDPSTNVVFRWCTIDAETYQYATVSNPIDLAATTSKKTVGNDFVEVATFVMPEPTTEGAYLLLSSSPSLD